MNSRRFAAPLIQSVAIVAALTAFSGCRSLNGAPSLDLSADGIVGAPVLANKDGQTLAYNFRAVEPGVLYRASDFNRTRPGTTAEGQPLSFEDGQLFDALRALNIHHVVSLAPMPDYYAEEGYFQFWTKRSGYAITTSPIAVGDDDVYGTDDRSGVHAAGELLSIMKHRKPADGAVLIHGEAGKGAIGVMAAAYELARTTGRGDDAAAWANVVRRYLASNQLADGSPAVTADLLERIRPQLMFVSGLF